MTSPSISDDFACTSLALLSRCWPGRSLPGHAAAKAMVTTAPPVPAPSPRRVQTKKPALYKVLMLNDDYTPMEFVVLTAALLQDDDREDATRGHARGAPARRRRLRHLHL